MGFRDWRPNLSADEEATIERLRLRDQARIDQIDGSLEKSRSRGLAAIAAERTADIATERAVQNRLLLERWSLMSPRARERATEAAQAW